MTREALSWDMSQYILIQQCQPPNLLNKLANIDLATRTAARWEQQRVLPVRGHPLAILRGRQIQS